MKKTLAIILAVLFSAITVAIPVSAAYEDEVVITLFDGTDDEWLDNQNGGFLWIEELEGKNALVHGEATTSISLKRKFDADLSQYSRDNLYIIADIYVSQPVDDTSSGTLKIKNGDSVDPDNTEENNQLNFTVTELGLEAGWNHLELALSDASPDGGDDYTIADWFCLWVNNNIDYITVAIGSLEIVNRVEVADPVVEETVEKAVPEVEETEAVETVAEVEEVPEVETATAPATFDATLIFFAAVAATAPAAFMLKKKK